MKVPVALLLLLYLFTFPLAGKVTVIDGIKYYVSKDADLSSKYEKEILKCVHQDEENLISLILENEARGNIKYRGNKYTIIQSGTTNLKNQESINLSMLPDQDGDVEETFIISYAKGKRYMATSSFIRFKNEIVEEIGYHPAQIKSDTEGELNSKNMVYYDGFWNQYEFNSSGKIMRLWQNKSLSWYNIFVDDMTYYFTFGLYNEPEYIPKNTPANPERLLTEEKKIKSFLKKSNYSISHFETIKNKTVKIMELKFNKDLEITDFFMRKVDFIDGTIGDSITMTFDKGKKISEVRGK